MKIFIMIDEIGRGIVVAGWAAHQSQKIGGHPLDNRYPKHLVNKGSKILVTLISVWALDRTAHL